MNPTIVEPSRMLLAGIDVCGKDVSSIDIHGSWSIYEQSEPGIQSFTHRMGDGGFADAFAKVNPG